jgi:hypothetical protein
MGGAGDDATANVSFQIPAIPAHAVASASSDSFITATGPIDEDVEGIFFLDPVTGELSCWIMNIYTLKFSARFRYDKVVDDLNLKQHKGAKLLMVTGLLNYKNATKMLRPAQSVVYVINTSSGDFAAYTVPWNKNIAREDQHHGELRLLDKGKARTKAVRDT